MSRVHIVQYLTHTVSSGGGNVDNIKLTLFGPSLRWMIYEALQHGLRLEPYQGGWSSPTHHPSMTPVWLILELCPFKRLAYVGKEKTEQWSDFIDNNETL